MLFSIYGLVLLIFERDFEKYFISGRTPRLFDAKVFKKTRVQGDLHSYSEVINPQAPGGIPS